MTHKVLTEALAKAKRQVRPSAGRGEGHGGGRDGVVGWLEIKASIVAGVIVLATPDGA